MTKITAIEEVTIADVPAKPGVYLMLSDDVEYIYPWSNSCGKSRVYYIGRSNNLRERVKTHKKLCLEAADRPKYDYYYPRYEYAVYHGCNICWRTCKSTEEAKGTEADLLISFAKYYGAKPVANGQSAWPD
jgi:excinuclease UvrABC nuclease subunit